MTLPSYHCDLPSSHHTLYLIYCMTSSFRSPSHLSPVDAQYMMTAVEGMYGGLNALADSLRIDRIGPMHQAGSDSLLTAQAYFALLKKFVASPFDEGKFNGELYGLGTNHTKLRNKSTLLAGMSSRTQAAGAGVGGMEMQQQYSSSSGVVHYPISGGAAGMSQHTSMVSGHGGYASFAEESQSISINNYGSSF